MSKEIKWMDGYKDINSSSVSIGNGLHDKLFFPKAIELEEYIAGAIKAKDDSFRFLMSAGDAWKVTSHIVKTQLPLSDGVINIGYLHEAVEEVLATLGNLEALVRIKSDDYKEMSVMDDGSFTFAKGILDEDYIDADTDPYLTAGGYRTWKALAGTEVTYHLNRDMTVDASFESNCLRDHYNNNFYGNSTGGGTTEYAIGERVERRRVNGLGREWEYKGWKATLLKATVTHIDRNHLLYLINNFQHALYSAIKNN